MNYLTRERATLERFMPGFDAALADVPFTRLESSHSPGIALFRQYGGTALTVPQSYGGKNAGPVEMIDVQRAIASRSPSLAVASNMHTCTVVAVPPCDETAALLRDIAGSRLLLASGFADGQVSNSILSPKMKAERVYGGWRLSGQKTPCSLSKSMAFLTASVLIPCEGSHESSLALVTIPRDAAGMRVEPFGNGVVFEGAENGTVTLTGVFVPDELVAFFGPRHAANEAILKAFLWFELFVSAAYLGVASALVERVLLQHRGSPHDRLDIVSDTEGCMAALHSVATHIVTAGAATPEWAVAAALHVRFLVQKLIMGVCGRATELLGGMAFLSSPEPAMLLACARALAFHPPSRSSIAEALDKYVAGEPLIVP